MMAEERKKIVIELDYETLEILSTTMAGNPNVQMKFMKETPMDISEFKSMSAFLTLSLMVFRNNAGIARTYVKLPTCGYLWI